MARVLQVGYEIEDLFATDERIVVRGPAHGIGAAAVHGPEAAGKPYAMATLHLYRAEGERLAEHWGVRDELGTMIQLGLVPMPAAPPELQALLAPLTPCGNARRGWRRAAT